MPRMVSLPLTSEAQGDAIDISARLLAIETAEVRRADSAMRRAVTAAVPASASAPTERRTMAMTTSMSVNPTRVFSIRGRIRAACADASSSRKRCQRIAANRPDAPKPPKPLNCRSKKEKAASSAALFPHLGGGELPTFARYVGSSFPSRPLDQVQVIRPLTED